MRRGSLLVLREVSLKNMSAAVLFLAEEGILSETEATAVAYQLSHGRYAAFLRLWTDRAGLVRPHL